MTQLQADSHLVSYAHGKIDQVNCGIVKRPDCIFMLLKKSPERDCRTRWAERDSETEMERSLNKKWTQNAIWYHSSTNVLFKKRDTINQRTVLNNPFWHFPFQQLFDKTELNTEIMRFDISFGDRAGGGRRLFLCLTKQLIGSDMEISNREKPSYLISQRLSWKYVVYAIWYVSAW